MSEQRAYTPRVDSKGVPWCSYDECPQYDGKRCRMTGFRAPLGLSAEALAARVGGTLAAAELVGACSEEAPAGDGLHVEGGKA